MKTLRTAAAVLLAGSGLTVAGLAASAPAAQAAPGDCHIRKTLTTGFAGCDKGTPGYIQVIISCTGEPLNKLGPKIYAGSGVESALSCPKGKYVDYTSYNYYRS